MCARGGVSQARGSIRSSSCSCSENEIASIAFPSQPVSVKYFFPWPSPLRQRFRRRSPFPASIRSLKHRLLFSCIRGIFYERHSFRDPTIFLCISRHRLSRWLRESRALRTYTARIKNCTPWKVPIRCCRGAAIFPRFSRPVQKVNIYVYPLR